MSTDSERADEDMPTRISYAVLTVDGRLLFEKTVSNPEFRDGTLYHNGPWDAAIAAIGGPCRSLARERIGEGLMAWVADESLLRPDDYPRNGIGGRTLNILIDFERQGFSATTVTEPDDRPWAGPIVITSIEDRGRDRWCGFIWPLDDDQEWLIREAWRAATGDDLSLLYTDDLDVDDEE
jgi:hypothetical protein